MGTIRGDIFIEEGGFEIAKYHAPKTAREVLDARGRNGGKLLDPDGFQLIGSDSLGAGRYILEHIDAPLTTAPAGLSPSMYIEKKLSRVVSLLDTAPDMADTPYGGIEALLQSFLEEETVRAFGTKLASSKYTAATLLEMSEHELDEIMDEEFPEAVRGDRRGFKKAILSKKRKPTQEGEPPLKKGKRSLEEYQSSDAVDTVESKVATSRYYEKLLEAPPELPKSTEELQKFLSATTEKLPLGKKIYSIMQHPDLVKPCTSEAEESLASILYAAFSIISTPLENEASSSYALAFLTGQFIMHLNEFAPVSKQLRDLRCILDSANPGSSKSATSALLPLLRPDYQVFVEGVLMLRWENKIVMEEILDAKEENRSKLEVWSPLYYGKLPYVIGGCCGGKIFRWLKLSPNGKEIVAEYISGSYDLSMPGYVALFLHSVIRMHCLLKNLKEELGDHIPLKLYAIDRRPGGEVSIYPAFVEKVVMPAWGNEKMRMFKSLYASIKGSRFLIQLKYIRTVKGGTRLQLEPVGDPHARPGVLEDLKAAVHDVLHGLEDLHKQGYTHRDLRWVNFIKINVLGEWQWVIIDLEAAGRDGEEWDCGLLRDWDERTLDGPEGKKIYTKASDIYQLGKLIVEWFGTRGGEEEALYKLGEKMRQERPAATTMLKEICMSDCPRCGKLDRASLNSGRH